MIFSHSLQVKFGCLCSPYQASFIIPVHFARASFRFHISNTGCYSRQRHLRSCNPLLASEVVTGTNTPGRFQLVLVDPAQQVATLPDTPCHDQYITSYRPDRALPSGDPNLDKTALDRQCRRGIRSPTGKTGADMGYCPPLPATMHVHSPLSMPPRSLSSWFLLPTRRNCSYTVRLAMPMLCSMRWTGPLSCTTT